MQSFIIEVTNSPVQIKLTDREYFEEFAVLDIVKKENGRGFTISVRDITDRVSIRNGPDEFDNEFTFDKKDFEERMEKMRSKNAGNF